MIGYRVTFDVCKGAMLTIDDHVNLTQDLVISCGSEITIGAYSGIGEYSSIRDGEHGYSAQYRIHQQPTTYSAIVIGSDVQISRGCMISGGSRIENGAIIGANSMVTGRVKTVEFGIYIGQPVKFIGKRT